MPVSSKFLTASTGEKIVKIGQYLAKIRTKYDSLLFLGHPVFLTSRELELILNMTVSMAVFAGKWQMLQAMSIKS